MSRKDEEGKVEQGKERQMLNAILVNHLLKSLSAAPGGPSDEGKADREAKGSQSTSEDDSYDILSSLRLVQAPNGRSEAVPRPGELQRSTAPSFLA